MSHDWGVPFPSNAAATGARKPLVAYTAAAGVRDVAFGSAILTMALLRDRRAVGVFALAGSIAGVGDGVIARHFGATPLQTAIHWTPGALCAAFGALLLL